MRRNTRRTSDDSDSEERAITPASNRRTRDVSDDEFSAPEEATPAKGKSKSAKRRKVSSDDEEEDFAGTQASGMSKLSDEEREKLVSNFVRYCLFQDTRKAPIKYNDIGKAVVKEYASKARNLSKFVFQRGSQRLRDVFGLELVELPKSVTRGDEDFDGSGNYILRPSQGPQALMSRAGFSPPNADERALLVAVLAVIELHGGNSMSEDRFYTALEAIDLDRADRNHPVFGDWDEKIKGFIRQQYLLRVKNLQAAVDGVPGSEFEIIIGPRAIVEFGRAGIYKAVCEIARVEPDRTRLKELLERDKRLVPSVTAVASEPMQPGQALPDQAAPAVRARRVAQVDLVE